MGCPGCFFYDTCVLACWRSPKWTGCFLSYTWTTYALLSTSLDSLTRSGFWWLTWCRVLRAWWLLACLLRQRRTQGGLGCISSWRSSNRIWFVVYGRLGSNITRPVGVSRGQDWIWAEGLNDVIEIGLPSGEQGQYKSCLRHDPCVEVRFDNICHLRIKMISAWNLEQV